MLKIIIFLIIFSLIWGKICKEMEAEFYPVIGIELGIATTLVMLVAIQLIA